MRRCRTAGRLKVSNETHEHVKFSSLHVNLACMTSVHLVKGEESARASRLLCAWLNTCKRQVIRATLSCNLSRNNCCVAIVYCCPITFLRATKSRNSVFFLQHENLLRAEVVIYGQLTITTCNATFVAPQVARKCCQ